jgi:hypothetical protein
MSSVAPVVRAFRLTTSADLQTTWAAFSDTDRINRLAAFGMRFEVSQGPGGEPVRRGWMRRYGLTLRWIERPVLHDAPRAWRIERIVENGPVTRMIAACKMSARQGGGTDLAYDLEIQPRAAIFRPLVEFDLGGNLAKRLEQALQRTIAALDQGLPPPDVAPPQLGRAARKHLDALIGQVAPTRVADELHAFLTDAPLNEQDRMQPLVLARRWSLPDDEVIAGCVSAVRAGLLVLRWDLLCPSCQLPAAVDGQLQPGRGTAHCPACDVTYDATFPDAVAVTFRPAPAVRTFAVTMACLSSPARVPHMVAQALVAAGGELDWQVSLLEGTYRLRTWPQVDPASLSVRPGHPSQEATAVVTQHGIVPAHLRANAGRVLLCLRSKLDRPLRVVIERRWQPPHTLTAGRLLELPEAAALLPPDALAPGVASTVTPLAIVAVQVLRGGDMGLALAVQALRSGGARTVQAGNGAAVAVFELAEVALAAVEPMHGALFLATVVACGPVLETHVGQAKPTLGGRSVQEALRLARAGAAGEVVLIADPTLEPALTAAADRWRRVAEAAPGAPAQLVFLGTAAPLQLPGAPTAEPATGDLIDGRYELGQRLGRGGFGTVFLATDGHDGSELVIKLLHGVHHEDPVQVQRFFNEGRLLARLQHPNVVRVVDWGQGGDGRLFLALERLVGRELAEVMKETRVVDPVRALRLASDALAGLHAVHRAGLVHRDLKPGNLFVIGEGTGERCKLIDFGIAYDVTGSLLQPDDAGTIVGTPHYMAPEQVEGKPVDPRADLYALAVVVYECVAGRLPFQGDTAMAVLLARLQHPAEPLEQAVAIALPAGLAEAVMRALEQVPDARWPDAESMRHALVQVLVGLHGREREVEQAWQKLRAERAGRGDDERPTLDL